MEARSPSGSILGIVRDAVRFGTPALSTDGERAFVQARIALLARVLTVIGAVAMVVAYFGVPKIFPTIDPASLLPVHAAQASILLIFIAVYLYCRKGDRPASTLYTVEAFLAIAFGTSVSMVLWYMPDEARDARPELGMVFGLGNALALRAAFVPSTPLRTFVVSLKTLAPLPLMVWFVMRTKGELASIPGPAQVGFVVAWSVLSIAVVTLISRVVHGMSIKMRQIARLGQYTLEQKIGEGGMGVVYRARHAMLRRPTAVKLLPPERSGEAAVRRFEREVQLTSRLTHPNTIAIYDFGRTPENVFYYAMEYLEGLTLEELVVATGPLPEERVIHILTQVAGALGEAHQAGIIHRDVKPANIILCERGGVPDVAKVLDFGLVKDLESEGDVKLSNTQTLTGTPLYLSPEAIRSPTTVGPSSDLYALGAVGYFLLTGRHAFEAPTLVEVCGKHLHGHPEPIAEVLGKPVSSDIEAVISACLAKSTGDRPEHAEALIEKLLTCGAAGSWTLQRAKAFWREHRAQTEPLKIRAGEADPHAATVAIDLAGR